MKKTIRRVAGIMPVLLLMILLAACARDDGHKSYETTKLLQGSTYYYEGEFFDGSDLDGYTIKMAVWNSEFVIAFLDEQGAELGRSVKVDGKGYYVDAAAKQYTRDNYYDDVTFAYSDFEFVESGTAKIAALTGVNETALYFEKYEVQYGDEAGSIRFFFQDDKLYAIQEDFTDAAGTDISEVVVIKKISSEVPEDWFGIPEDYTEAQ